MLVQDTGESNLRIVRTSVEALCLWYILPYVRNGNSTRTFLFRDRKHISSLQIPDRRHSTKLRSIWQLKHVSFIIWTWSNWMYMCILAIDEISRYFSIFKGGHVENICWRRAGKPTRASIWMGKLARVVSADWHVVHSHLVKYTFSMDSLVNLEMGWLDLRSCGCEWVCTRSTQRRQWGGYSRIWRSWSIRLSEGLR